jgi:hypothetical protein
MWLPWFLRLCIGKKPVVKKGTIDTSIKGDARPEQAITSPRNRQPAYEPPIPSPAPHEGHQQVRGTVISRAWMALDAHGRSKPCQKFIQHCTNAYIFSKQN